MLSNSSGLDLDAVQVGAGISSGPSPGDPDGARPLLSRDAGVGDRSEDLAVLEFHDPTAQAAIRRKLLHDTVDQQNVHAA